MKSDRIKGVFITDRDLKSSENLFLQPAPGRALKWLLVHPAGLVGVIL